MLSISRCEDCKGRRSSVAVVQESDRMDMSLEDLSLLRPDHQSLVGTLKQPPPHYEDFLQWNATQLFAENIPEDLGASSEVSGDNEDRPEVLKSWQEVKNELDQIFAASVTERDPQSGCGSRSLSDVEEQFREVQKRLDTLFQIVGSLDEQLKATKSRNASLTESLNDTKQLLQAERQRQMEGTHSDY